MPKWRFSYYIMKNSRFGIFHYYLWKKNIKTAFFMLCDEKWPFQHFSLIFMKKKRQNGGFHIIWWKMAVTAFFTIIYEKNNAEIAFFMLCDEKWPFRHFSLLFMKKKRRNGIFHIIWWKMAVSAFFHREEW